MTQAQQRTSQELASKLNKSPYQFERKGNEVQFQFNTTMKTLSVPPRRSSHSPHDQLRRSERVPQKNLDDGIKAITKRQKHIKVADCSDYDWATVQAYDMDDLASSSEDEKRFEKAEKEAERRAARKRCAGCAKFICYMYGHYAKLSNALLYLLEWRW